MCGCNGGNIAIEYRYSNKELDEMKKKIEKACDKKQDI